tara:strand:- start:236 stop:490 length:255 start_codon:yes stop_codon:yes gene_type:complete
MSGLFGRPKPKKDPKVEANLAEQEAQAERDKAAEGRRVQARVLARRGGGMRGRSQLMAQGVTAGTRGRDTPELQSTLGRNPRMG